MEPLSDPEIATRLQTLPEWRRDGDEIVRDLECDDFTSAVAFLNRVADEAERADHHPDMLLHGYRHLRITLATHSAGGLTERDFALARKIETLSQNR